MQYTQETWPLKPEDDSLKIEKINDNQIRCTLNGNDLHSRQLSLIELAYGTEKARRLFHEVVERADAEVGFQIDDYPLMIEAIPLSSEGIIVIITKIDDPDELDTRFARFAPGIDDDPEVSVSASPGPAAAGSAGDILDAITRMIEGMESADKASSELELAAVFRFSDLEPILDAAAVLRDYYAGNNSLYRSERDHSYSLVVHKSGHTPEEFNKVCNVLTEYGTRIRSNSASEAFLLEHSRRVVADRALQTISHAVFS